MAEKLKLHESRNAGDPLSRVRGSIKQFAAAPAGCGANFEPLDFTIAHFIQKKRRFKSPRMKRKFEREESR